MRIVLFSERLRLPLDEGFKNTALSLAQALRRQHDVQVLTAFGLDIPSLGVRNVRANRLLLSDALRRAVRDFAPDVILYVPTASATPAAMLRTRVLASFANRASVALLALQPRPYSALARMLIRLLRPPLVVTQSAAMAAELAALGCTTACMSSGVDSALFAPVSPEQRRRLRQELGLPENAFVVFHAGHINQGRNVQVLAELQQAGCQAILIGSTSTEQDARLAGSLQEAGVIVVRDYVQHIEQYYQAADCYVFPVMSDTGAIAVPLSVLEAMACNLPVVTTPYGNLPALFVERDGLHFARSHAELIAGVESTRTDKQVSTRDQVLPHSWDSVATAILALVTGSNQ